MTTETSTPTANSGTAPSGTAPSGTASPPASEHLSTAVITVDEKVPAMHIWRDVRASVAQVMRAHTDASLFARWIGPHALTTEIDVWECRTLGAYRYVQRRGDEAYAFRGTFPEVGEGRIVQTFCFEDWPEAIALETMTLTDLDDGRTRIHGFSLCDSFEARDAFIASGMETGVNEGYEKLDALLAETGDA